MRALIRLLAFFTLILSGIGALCVSAAAPPQITYQGRLTDAGGSPVADGAHTVSFSIYDAPVAGIAYWASGPVSVTTSAGLFKINLGGAPMFPLTANIFTTNADRWLGITVGLDPELTPRTYMTAVPYALSVGSIDSAGAGAIFGNLSINSFGSDYVRSNGGFNSLSTINGSAVEATRLWGPSFGEFDAFDNSGTQRVGLGAGFTGFPFLNLTGSVQSISLSPDVGGDASVSLPADAISSQEMLNEPGITQNAANQTLGAAPGTFENITSVTITTPASGYIVITGDGEAGVGAPAATSAVVRLGIATASASPPVNGNYFVGCSTTANGATEYYQYSTSMVDQQPAGTYTYYMVATRTNAAATASMYRCHFRAMYIPTSYGAVLTPVPPSLAHDFSEPKSFIDSKTGANEALVDLRELEVKAARAKAAADAAELALVKARQKQNIDPSKDAGTTPGDNR